MRRDRITSECVKLNTASGLYKVFRLELDKNDCAQRAERFEINVTGIGWPADKRASHALPRHLLGVAREAKCKS